jgi:hypothetical protein
MKFTIDIMVKSNRMKNLIYSVDKFKEFYFMFKSLIIETEIIKQ